ncbi:MAG: hypothetical protein QM775_34510 [Pirellulales bacterium]
MRQVFGVVSAQQPRAKVAVHARLMALDELSERLTIAALCGCD